VQARRLRAGHQLARSYPRALRQTSGSFVSSALAIGLSQPFRDRPGEAEVEAGGGACLDDEIGVLSGQGEPEPPRILVCLNGASTPLCLLRKRCRRQHFERRVA